VIVALMCRPLQAHEFIAWRRADLWRTKPLLRNCGQIARVRRIAIWPQSRGVGALRGAMGRHEDIAGAGEQYGHHRHHPEHRGHRVPPLGSLFLLDVLLTVWTPARFNTHRARSNLVAP